MQDGRMMCRDQNGGFRLMPGVNIMDALDKLGEIEERAQGVLVDPVSKTALETGKSARKQAERKESGT